MRSSVVRMSRMFRRVRRNPKNDVALSSGGIGTLNDSVTSVPLPFGVNF
jgi:hypothetical protein